MRDKIPSSLKALGRVRALLEEVALPEVGMGPPRNAVDTQQLREGLQRILRKNERYFTLVVGMILILFICLVVATFTRPSEPNVGKALSTVVGVSASGLIWKLVGLVRERQATELLLELAVTLQGDALDKLVRTLLRRI